MAILSVVLMEFGDFAMLRRMLRGIKERAETLASEPEPSDARMSGMPTAVRSARVHEAAPALHPSDGRSPHMERRGEPTCALCPETRYPPNQPRGVLKTEAPLSTS